MTPAEVERLRALADAATPGPWRHTRADASWVSFPVGVRVRDWGSAADCRTVADAAFIAAARAAVPALCDEVDRLTRELAAMTAERDSARAALDHAEAMKRNWGQK